MIGGVKIETLLDCLANTGSCQYQRWSFIQRRWKCTWTKDSCPHKGDKEHDHKEEFTIKLTKRDWK
jgi:hypothetical protein